MNPKTLAETGLTLIGEAVLSFIFNPTNARTKRDDLQALGIPFELGHEVLKHLEMGGKVVRDSQASYWRLSHSEHEARQEGEAARKRTV